MATQALTQKPTGVRHWVIFFAVTLAIITYIDRVCISQAIIFIEKDLGISTTQKGYVFGAFTLAYALFEIPGGYLGDVMGPRRVLMRVVVWWSFFTAATGWAWSFTSMVITRFMFGAGEAGCFPNVTKAFTTWLPQSERVRAQGIVWMSARWGGAFTPLLVQQILQVMHWRRAFELFGVIGIVWAVFFYRWFRDNPRENRSVNEAEARLIEGARGEEESHTQVPWGLLVRSKQAWLLCGQYFCLSYGWYFYITWLPTYLKNARGLDLATSALLATLPLFLGGVGCFLCGNYFFPWLAKATNNNVGQSRRLMAYLGFTGATGFLLLSTRIESPALAMLAMGMASFSNDLVMPGSWGACMDVGGPYAGTLSGAMNMMGNMGGVVSPIAIGYILQYTNNNWDITFYISAAVYFAGAFFWMALDPVTPLTKSARRARA